MSAFPLSFAGHEMKVFLRCHRTASSDGLAFTLLGRLSFFPENINSWSGSLENSPIFGETSILRSSLRENAPLSKAQWWNRQSATPLRRSSRPFLRTGIMWAAWTSDRPSTIHLLRHTAQVFPYRTWTSLVKATSLISRILPWSILFLCSKGSKGLESILLISSSVDRRVLFWGLNEAAVEELGAEGAIEAILGNQENVWQKVLWVWANVRQGQTLLTMSRERLQVANGFGVN